MKSLYILAGVSGTIAGLISESFIGAILTSALMFGGIQVFTIFRDNFPDMAGLGDSREEKITNTVESLDEFYALNTEEIIRQTGLSIDAQADDIKCFR